LCVHLVGALGQGSSLGSDPDHLEYRIKAAFLYNFARFVEWPTDRSTNEADPTLTIAVLGEDPFGPVLDATVEGKLVQGKKLRIKRFRSFAEVIGRCDVLFISTSEKKSLPAILARLRGRSILAVGETEDFLDHGGMIEFQIRGGAVRFDVNLAAAEQAGLHLSSQLLKVASKVKRSE
jgi:hypothetical protein